MGLHKNTPPMSGRMGTLWTLSSIRNAALVEYGCMGHMIYSRIFLNRVGVTDSCKMYATHIDETDISLGDTKRLNKAVDEIIKRDNPQVLFLIPSTVPTVIGTDLPALCKELQPEHPNVPIIAFGNGSFDVYGHQGIRDTLVILAKNLTKEIKKTKKPTFNIIGSCADMFRYYADCEEIKRIMKGAFDMEPVCVMTSDTSVKDIKDMGSAHINLVIRNEGEEVAKYLNTKFRTPYLLSRPYGIDGTVNWINEISQICSLKVNEDFIKQEVQDIKTRLLPAMPVLNHMIRSHKEEATISIGGHYDVVRGILSYALNEFGLYKGDCWCDCSDMADDNLPFFNEEQLSNAINSKNKGILMASGEVLKKVNGNMDMQISNPDLKWRLNPYEPPMVGFRGAIHLSSLWLNSLLDQDE